MNDEILSLAGTWRLRAADEKKTVSCPIPGDNYSALQDAGRIPDPYWRDNGGAACDAFPGSGAALYADRPLATDDPYRYFRW